MPDNLENNSKMPEGVYLIPIPTPFPVGDVNVYLIKDEKVVLVDTGPKTDEAVQVLKEGLKRYGIEIRDIDEIWLTHGHPDHFGLAVELADWSGAVIRKPQGEEVNFEHNPIISQYQDFYSGAGIPDSFQKYAFEQLMWYQSFSDVLDIPATALPGDHLETGTYSFDVKSVPGHSPGHVAFVEKSRFAFGGDVLIEHISSNAVIAFDVKTGKRRDSLGELRNSMKELSESSEVVMPGHGNILRDPDAVANKHLQMQEKRLQKIRGKLHRPMNLFELSMDMFPKAKDPEILFLAVSEVVGYLDWGVKTGMLQKSLHDAVVYYASV